MKKTLAERDDFDFDYINEEIVKKAMATAKCEIVKIEFEGMDKLPLLPSKIDGTLCIKPTELYEGFYVAKIRKLK